MVAKLVKEIIRNEALGDREEVRKDSLKMYIWAWNEQYKVISMRGSQCQHFALLDKHNISYKLYDKFIRGYVLVYSKAGVVQFYPNTEVSMERSFVPEAVVEHFAEKFPEFNLEVFGWY